MKKYLVIYKEQTRLKGFNSKFNFWMIRFRIENNSPMYVFSNMYYMLKTSYQFDYEIILILKLRNIKTKLINKKNDGKQ